MACGASINAMYLDLYMEWLCTGHVLKSVHSIQLFIKSLSPGEQLDPYVEQLLHFRELVRGVAPYTQKRTCIYIEKSERNKKNVFCCRIPV